MLGQCNGIVHCMYMEDKAELYGRCLLNMEALGERIWVMVLSFDQTWWRLPTQLNNEGP